MASSHDDDDAMLKKAVKDTRLHSVWFPIITLVNVIQANMEVTWTQGRANKSLGRIFARNGWQKDMGTSTDLKYTVFMMQEMVIPTGKSKKTQRKFY
jgi:hypothetical protein